MIGNRTADSDGKAFECLLRYHFKTRGELHDVQVEHKGGAWRVLSDGVMVVTKKHNKSNPLTSAKHSLQFDVKTGLPDGNLRAAVNAIWVISSSKWKYDFIVHGKALEPAWFKQSGGEPGPPPMELLGEPIGNGVENNPPEAWKEPVAVAAPVAYAEPAGQPYVQEQYQEQEQQYEEPAQNGGLTDMQPVDEQSWNSQLPLMYEQQQQPLVNLAQPAQTHQQMAAMQFMDQMGNEVQTVDGQPPWENSANKQEYPVTEQGGCCDGSSCSMFGGLFR
jgi:hypothetical protein